MSLKLTDATRFHSKEAFRAAVLRSTAKRVLHPPQYQSETLVGVEIEIENCRSARDPQTEDELRRLDKLVHPYWQVVEDGSLRNHGAEFVSRVGMNITEVLSGIQCLNEWLNTYTEGRFNYRTGVHVHIGFNDSTVENVKNFFMLYALFEDTLFKMSGDRRENKFCCPVRESYNDFQRVLLFDESKSSIFQFFEILADGQKYLAFNYRPLSDIGTIEFRHHYGTADYDVLSRWIETIDRLFLYAHKVNFKELKERIFGLNTYSYYHKFAEEVFGELIRHHDDSIVTDMREGSLYIKECFVNVDNLVVRQTQPPQNPRRPARTLNTETLRWVAQEQANWRINPLLRGEEPMPVHREAQLRQEAMMTAEERLMAAYNRVVAGNNQVVIDEF